MRHLQAHNFLGVVFISLIKDNKTEITIRELNNIEKALDKELRKNNDTLIYVTIDDIYTIINTYNFFEIDENENIIKLSNYSMKKYTKNKEELLDTLDSYFQAGIPIDILNAIKNKLKDF